MSKTIVDVPALIQRLVALGYFSAQDIAERLFDALAEAGLAEDFHGAFEVIAQVVENAFLAAHAQQQAWTSPTACDRISAAFQRLESVGIGCMECCGGSVQEGWETFLHHRGAEPLEGAVFFHEQDVEHALAAGSMSFTFGSLSEGKPDEGKTAQNARIGAQVMAALLEQDLPATWSGNPSEPILVGPIQWQKRVTPDQWAERAVDRMGPDGEARQAQRDALIEQALQPSHTGLRLRNIIQKTQGTAPNGTPPLNARLQARLANKDGSSGPVSKRK